jgi:hypothetical protein
VPGVSGTSAIGTIVAAPLGAEAEAAERKEDERRHGKSADDHEQVERREDS